MNKKIFKNIYNKIIFLLIDIKRWRTLHNTKLYHKARQILQQ